MTIQEALRRYNQQIKREDDLYRQAARRLDLPEATLWILYALRDTEEQLTQKDLTGAMLQSKQSVNSALKRMEADGLVVLTPDPENRTRKYICLTDAGEALAQRTVDRLRTAEFAAMDAFSQEECECFLSLYAKWNKMLSATLDKQLGEGEPRL